MKQLIRPRGARRRSSDRRCDHTANPAVAAELALIVEVRQGQAVPVTS